MWEDHETCNAYYSEYLAKSSLIFGYLGNKVRTVRSRTFISIVTFKLKDGLPLRTMDTRKCTQAEVFEQPLPTQLHSYTLILILDKTESVSFSSLVYYMHSYYESLERSKLMCSCIVTSLCRL